MIDAWCLMLDARCLMLAAAPAAAIRLKLSHIEAWCLMLHVWCLMLGIRLELGLDDWCLMLDSSRTVLELRTLMLDLMLDAWCLMLDAWNWIRTWTWCLMIDAWYLILGTWLELCTYVPMYVLVCPCTNVPMCPCMYLCDLCTHVLMCPCTYLPMYLGAHVLMYPCIYVWWNWSVQSSTLLVPVLVFIVTQCFSYWFQLEWHTDIRNTMSRNMVYNLLS